MFALFPLENSNRFFHFKPSETWTTLFLFLNIEYTEITFFVNANESILLLKVSPYFFFFFHQKKNGKLIFFFCKTSFIRFFSSENLWSLKKIIWSSVKSQLLALSLAVKNFGDMKNSSENPKKILLMSFFILFPNATGIFYLKVFLVWLWNKIVLAPISHLKVF